MKTHVLAASFLAAFAGGVVGAESVDPVISAEVVEVPAAKASTVNVAMTTVAGFSAKLTPDERAASGVEKLSEEQRVALDAQVAKEVKLARQGNVTGFAGTFISRRSEDERTAVGLGILNTSEKYQLDRQVARALAETPAQPPLALARAATENDIFKKPFKWETHGFVQLEYGFGSGDREYKAATVGVSEVNPRTGTTFTFVYTASEGDGLWYCPDYSMSWHSRPYGPWRY
jgi:hypothetical protein